MKIPFPSPPRHLLQSKWSVVWKAGFVWLLLARSLFASATNDAGEGAIEGHPVVEVRVVDEAGKTAAEHLPPLSLKTGRPFDFGAERESLRTLYRTGDFADIRVSATDETDGLHVAFIVRRNYYNNSIRVIGLKPPPTEPAAVATLRLSLGEPFRESSLHEGIERLLDALHEDGLYQAKITSSVAPHDDTRQMDITIHVDPGPRALVGAITVKNQTTFPDAELIHRSKLGEKKALTLSQLSHASQRLKKFLVGRGYLGAGAVLTPGTYDPETNNVPLTYAVTAGPRVKLEVHGAKLKRDRLRKLVPVYAEGAVDEDLLQEGRRNIRDYFQRQGYFDADVQVNSRRDAQSGDQIIGYEISLGGRFRLARIKFIGNKYFSYELLYKRLQLQTASFASSGKFSQRLVHDDGDSIRALYLSNGFREAQVTSTVDNNYEGRKGNLSVTYTIGEGGGVLGIFPVQGFSLGIADLAPGDRLILFTDGVTEACCTDDEEFGEERLLRLLEENRAKPAGELQKMILAAAGEFSHGDWRDDATVIVLAST
jgi:outer membrane protein insertion porin family